MENYQGEMPSARKASLSGTPKQRNLVRELVERKQFSDCGRHIRIRDRQLSRASKDSSIRSRVELPDRDLESVFGRRKDFGCGDWLAEKDLLDSNPPASTPNSHSRLISSQEESS